MHHSFHGYVPRTKGERLRSKGVLISQEAGITTAYALESTQERGNLFVGPATPVYGGMIVGESSRDTTLTVNPCKKKALTNMRASGSDDAAILTPYKKLTLEQAIEFIETDELVEVTPKKPQSEDWGFFGVPATGKRLMPEPSTMRPRKSPRVLLTSRT